MSRVSVGDKNPGGRRCEVKLIVSRLFLKIRPSLGTSSLSSMYHLMLQKYTVHVLYHLTLRKYTVLLGLILCSMKL